MKFHFFHLMPWPHLPDDFRERYHSVWVDVPSTLYDPVRGNQVYNDYLDELEFADQVGFDGICVNEHHSNAYGMMPSPNLMACALARRTTNAKIVLMGNSVALYNPPIRVAEEMAMLDVISGGRLVSGFPVGTVMDTTFCYGVNPATLRDRYREAVELILRSWQEEEPFTFNGRFTQLRYVNVWPRPIQKPHPPIWVPGGGSVETWDWCAEHDFLYAYLSFVGFEMGRKNVEGYWQAVDRLGKERNPYRAGFLQGVALAESDDQAEELYSEAALYHYNRCLHTYAGFLDSPGYTTLETIRKGVHLQSAVKHASEAYSRDLTWKDITERRYIIAGTPDAVTEQIDELRTVLNVGHLMILGQFGNLGKDAAMKNIRMFAEGVIPRLRDRFSEWDDHWFPSAPLSQRAVPAAGG
jgi:alkanesulfonate monooxygenase SsuD/methylene tetrahydromethanopterin reductase-like flavin-dependent oxidoreductase (luciferase family)